MHTSVAKSRSRHCSSKVFSAWTNLNDRAGALPDSSLTQAWLATVSDVHMQRETASSSFCSSSTRSSTPTRDVPLLLDDDDITEAPADH